MNFSKYPNALHQGSILHGRYIVKDVLGQGGFGITYKALDYQTGEYVAIKEYYPRMIATRNSSYTVLPQTGQNDHDFEYGKSQFLEEAKTLSEFIDTPSVVKVYSYFKENGTAYFVMEYLEGVSLSEYLRKKGGRIPWHEARDLLMPLMDALSAVHEKNIVHRDIKPDNIIITNDGLTKLLDFGAARYVYGVQSHSLDTILTPGFAPFEQYFRRGHQGPWTDVYALAATMYCAITGTIPPEAVERSYKDTLTPPASMGVSLPDYAEAAILKALAVHEDKRYQNMSVFKYAVLNGMRREKEEKKREQQEVLRRQEEERRRQEEEKKKREQQEVLRRREEERRKQEEEKKKREQQEVLRRQEEERRKQEEEKKKREQQEVLRRQEEERRKQEEEKKKREQQEVLRRQEEERRKQEEEKLKKENKLRIITLVSVIISAAAVVFFLLKLSGAFSDSNNQSENTVKSEQQIAEQTERKDQKESDVISGDSNNESSPSESKGTVTAYDVKVYNSAEDRTDNIIGTLNDGDEVTVKSRTTDVSGQEWYLVELPNGNTCYIKAEWVSVFSSNVEMKDTNKSDTDESGTDDTDTGTRQSDDPMALTDSWEQIIAAGKDGTYKDRYRIGDTKELDLGEEGIIHMKLAAMDADELADGSGKAHMTWIAVELIKSEHQMNLTSTNEGGWPKSDMRTWLRDSIFPLFPDNLKLNIKEVRKYSYSYSDGDNISSKETIWIPSMREVVGGSEGRSSLGYEYSWENRGPEYTAVFPDDESRVKRQTGASKSSWWWLRSASVRFGIVFNYVDNDGAWSDSSRHFSRSQGGVAVGFCL